MRPFSKLIVDTRHNTPSFSVANNRGVSMLQFALILPFLMGVVAIIIDIGRFHAIKNVLDYGARAGLEVATTVRNLDVNLQDSSVDDVDYIRFTEARRRVAEAAVRTPLATLVTDYNVNSDARLLKHDYQDAVSVAADEEQPSYSYSAAFIRPYERVKRVREGFADSFIDHPQKPYLAGEERDIVVAMETVPVVVEVAAELNLLLPFLKPLVITGRAAGYRRFIPNGPFDQETEERIGTWDDYLASLTTTTTNAPGTTTPTTPTPTPTICRVDWAFCNAGGNPVVLCPNPAVPRGGPTDPCDCETCSAVIESIYIN